MNKDLPDERAPVDFLDWLLFPIFLAAFVLVLLVFEVIQRICYRFGSQPQQVAALWLSICLKACLRIVGTRFEIQEPSPGYIKSLPNDRPYIAVATHQSLFDICILAALFGRHFPRYISKKELAYGIPSVSYNLRVGGAALIDRKNPRQAIPEIKRFGAHLTATKCLVVIFPEGTRSRTGELKELQSAGLTVLLAAAPTAEVIPVVLDGTWRLSSRKYGPVPRNTLVKISVLPLMTRTADDAKKLCAETLSTLRQEWERQHQHSASDQ